MKNVIVSSNSRALKGASDFLQKHGYQCHIVSNRIEQDADEYGKKLSQVIESVISGQTFRQALKSASIPTADNVAPKGSI